MGVGKGIIHHYFFGYVHSYMGQKHPYTEVSPSYQGQLPPVNNPVPARLDMLKSYVFLQSALLT